MSSTRAHPVATAAAPPVVRARIQARRWRHLAGLLGIVVRVAALAVFLTIARAVVADQYHVPTPSMAPTIQSGDRIFVSKAAYGIRLPLTSSYLLSGADPDIGVRRVYVSSNIGPYPFSNGASYRNPAIDRLFDEAAELLDKPSRREKYVQIQRILADDVPYFWLVDTETLRAHRSTFTGFRLWTGAFAETVRPVATSRR